VLEAMGLPAWRTSGAVRLSFGPLATDDFIDEACARIRRCGQAARHPALAPSTLSGEKRGLQQVSAGGRHGWILFDAGAGASVVIDPPAGMAARIAAQVQGSGLRPLAVLGTGADPMDAGARAELRAACGLDGGETGPLGWPRDGAGEMVALADGGTAPAIAIGDELLVQLADRDGGGAVYLLGRARDGRLEPAAVRLAFTGGLAMEDAHGLARVVDGGTVLCHGLDAGGAPCTTAAGYRSAPSSAGEVQQLPPERLAAFLRAHEDALLVDVREACELEAGAAHLHGTAAQAVPLSRLAEHLGHFLAAPRRPLVFVCRSGNRSARAALCLQRLGHPQVWSLAGGLALASA
jgi:rhodanese-related sulfurtransferase